MINYIYLSIICTYLSFAFIDLITNFLSNGSLWKCSRSIIVRIPSKKKVFNSIINGNEARKADCGCYRERAKHFLHHDKRFHTCVGWSLEYFSCYFFKLLKHISQLPFKPIRRILSDNSEFLNVLIFYLFNERVIQIICNFFHSITL